MPDPTLRDRLVGIIVGAIIDGGPVGDHPALIADAILASEFGKQLEVKCDREARAAYREIEDQPRQNAIDDGFSRYR